MPLPQRIIRDVRVLEGEKADGYLEGILCGAREPALGVLQKGQKSLFQTQPQDLQV